MKFMEFMRAGRIGLWTNHDRTDNPKRSVSEEAWKCIYRHAHHRHGGASNNGSEATAAIRLGTHRAAKPTRCNCRIPGHARAQDLHTGVEVLITLTLSPSLVPAHSHVNTARVALLASSALLLCVLSRYQMHTRFDMTNTSPGYD